MKYDPIMCMMVPDKVTTKDYAVNEYEIHYTVPGKSGAMVGSGKGSTEAEAKADFMNYHKSENPKITSVKFYKKVSDYNTLDKAISNCDAENERWITMNGSHVKIDGEGNAVAGNEKVKGIINKGKSGEGNKAEKKQTGVKSDGNVVKNEVNKHKSYEDFHRKIFHDYYTQTFREGSDEDEEMKKSVNNMIKSWKQDGEISESDMAKYSLAYEKIQSMDFSTKKGFSNYMTKLDKKMDGAGIPSYVRKDALNYLYNEFKKANKA